MVSNPWLGLPAEPPFVLIEDWPVLDAFNQRATAHYRIETSLLPEPYVGRVDAPVILLLLNPGLSDEDLALHQRTEFRDRVSRCLHQEAVPYPNYYLDPALTCPGTRWMARIMRPLLKEFGLRTVANCVAQLE